MNLRSPATSYVAALDEPFRMVRRTFPDWAPPMFGLAVLGMVPGFATQWFNAGLTAAPGQEPQLGNLFGVLVTAIASGFAYFIGMLGAFAIAQRLVDGERPSFGDALVEALSPRMLLLGGAALLATFIGFGCIVGGPIIGGVVAFVPVAVLARPGWGAALSEAFTAATVRASPRDGGPPAFKLAAIVLVWYGINSVVNQLAVLPTIGWMAWNMANAIGSGDVLRAFQVQPPFAIGAVNVILAGLLRPFSDMYLAAAVVILWRDLARVREGADLEAYVDGRAA